MLERIRTAPRTVDEFATRIRTNWRKLAEGIIETGKLLIKAKEVLGHGQWQTMFDENNPNRLPFGDRTAQMLMQIAKHPIISNPKFISVLPASWGTLHKLADLPDKALEAMLADGTISADTTSKEVDELRKKIRGDGIYIWANLREGLNTLIKFQANWPDPTEIADQVIEEYWDEGTPLRELAVLPQWITGLCNACKQLEEESERKEQLNRERQRELESEDEAELDSEDEPALKARRSTKKLSFAERTRREIARARMRLRNGSEFPAEE